MTPRIAVVTATYPPDVCGVGDYTHHLASELGVHTDVTVITNRRKGTPPPGVPVTQVFDRYGPQTLRAVIPEVERLRADWVLVQYDPYSYGTPTSFNPYLPALVRRLKRRFPEKRVAVVVHEAFVAPTSFRRTVMSSWQRAQLWVMGRAADLLVFVIDGWARRLASWFPHALVMHLPVGNNVPRVEVDRTALRDELGVPADAFVLGWIGRGQDNRATWLEESVRAVVAAGARPFVVHAGIGAEAARETLGALPGRIAGLVSAAELSRHLSLLDVYVALFAEGLSSRRTSVVAALAHGLPVVASAGPATDRIFREENGRSLLLVDPGRGERFGDAVSELVSSTDLRAELGRHATMLVESHFSWSAIARKLLEGFARVDAKRRRTELA